MNIGGIAALVWDCLQSLENVGQPALIGYPEKVGLPLLASEMSAFRVALICKEVNLLLPCALVSRVKFVGGAAALMPS